LGHSVLCWHRVVEHIELINVNIRLYVVYSSDVFFLLRCLLGELLPSVYMVFRTSFDSCSHCYEKGLKANGHTT
jgi:hypothetical protein